jgi:SET domain-containing protein
MEHSDRVRVKRVKGKGRAVFATRSIEEGDVIERVPVLVVPVRYLAGGLTNPILQKYFYIWSKTSVGIALGYGSLYNHSFEPNADYLQDDTSLVYVALRDIAAGEEITINYNGNPDDMEPVNFPVV